MELSSLAGLPDIVKRNILSRLSEDSHQPALASASSSKAVIDVGQPHQALSGRQLHLPQMAAGAAIVDNVLSPQEVQAVAAATEAWLSQHGRRPGMGSSKSSGLWHDPSYRGDINCWVTPAELTAARQPLLAACLQMLASLRPQLAAQGFDVSGRCSCQLACYPGNEACYVRHTDASDSAPDRSVTVLLYLNTEWDTQVDGGQLALYNTPHSVDSHTAGCKARSIQDTNSSSTQLPDSTSTDPTATSLHSNDTPQQHQQQQQPGTMYTADTPVPAACTGSPSGGYLSGEPAVLVAPLGGRLLVFDSRLPHEVLPAHRSRYSITAWFYKGAAASSCQAAEVTSVPRAAAADHSAGGGTAGAGQGPAAGVAFTQQQHLVPSPAAPSSACRQQSTADHANPAQKGDTALADSSRFADPGPAAAAAALLTPPPPAAEAASAAVTPAASSAANTPQLPTIFVSVAAFRDEECQWTLRDLFLRASHPERVTVGVVWQVDPVADQGFVRLAGGDRTAQYHKQVREVRCHFSTATGPCAARSMAQQLWAGEDYVLQVDAHMRFVQAWDELCLSELQAAQQSAGHTSVVLSTYPPGYDGQGPAAAVPDAAPTTLLCAKEFDEVGLLRVQSRSLRQRPTAPLPCYFWAAGWSFAPSSWLLEVPYCPHLPHLFFGEEQYMLLRMWTRGWDIYAPSQPLAFHQWERKARPNSYQACVKIDGDTRAASQARVLKLTQSTVDEDSGAAAPSPLQRCPAAWHRSQTPSRQDWGLGGVWGLGTARSLQLYERIAGVSFPHRKLQPRALQGGQIETVFEL